MTRPTRTQHEIFAMEAMLKLFNDSKFTLIDDNSITDAPDWVFSINGEKIACEFSLLNLEKLMHWSHQKRTFESNKIYKIKIPNDPHFWLELILSKKSPKAPKYKASSGATKVWLTVHTEAQTSNSLGGASSSSRGRYRAVAQLREVNRFLQREPTAKGLQDSLYHCVALIYCN